MFICLAYHLLMPGAGRTLVNAVMLKKGMNMERLWTAKTQQARSSYRGVFGTLATLELNSLDIR